MGIRAKVVVLLVIWSFSCLACEKIIFDHVEQGNSIQVQKYLSNGGDPNMSRSVDINNCVYETGKCRPDTLLTLALLSYQEEIAIKLVKHGANFKNESKSLTSPVEIAIELDQLVFIQFLIENGYLQFDSKIRGYKFLELGNLLGGKKIQEYLESKETNQGHTRLRN